jgi:hypothetical protein
LNPIACIIMIVLGNLKLIDMLLYTLLFSSISLSMLVTYSGYIFKVSIRKYLRGEIIGRVDYDN